MKITIDAQDIQYRDRFVGGIVVDVAADAGTIIVEFDDGSIAYYDRYDSVTVLRD